MYSGCPCFHYSSLFSRLFSLDMKSVTSRPSNDVRKMVMYAKRDDQWVKSFEIDYQREK